MSIYTPYNYNDLIIKQSKIYATQIFTLYN